MRSMLLALQHADSFFPSGAVGFSHGLEMLRADGLVSDEAGVKAFITHQLQGRWQRGDRGAMIMAWEADGNSQRVAAADRLQEAMTLPQALREGSRRGGRALLSVHRHLRTRGAQAYTELIAQGEALGHLAVIQGLVWRGVGLSSAEASAMGAHTLCTACLGAALRLGLIGHLGAQRILGDLQPLIIEMLEVPPPGPEDLVAYAALGDIAVMRHALLPTRLFSN